jgi:hypothetical protein
MPLDADYSRISLLPALPSRNGLGAYKRKAFFISKLRLVT